MEARKQAIDKVYKRRNRYEIPEYQREEVWGVGEKQLLVDTILRGWKLPKFYFLKTSSSVYEVVDGQQRLSAIFEFLSGELELSEDLAERYGGAQSYFDLSDDISDRFDDFEIDYDEIEDASEGEIEEFFKRLQQGFRLNSAERLNAIPGKLTSFARTLSKNRFFKKSISFKDKRYAYFDVAAKAVAIEIEGLDAGMRINELEPLFKSQAAFSASSKVGKRLKEALDFLGDALPDDSRALRLRSITQSVITLACRLVEHGKAKGNEKEFSAFLDHFINQLSREVEAGHSATDTDYLAFQRTVSANVKGGARIRHNILLRKLFQFDSSFIDGFGADIIAASGTDQAISEMQVQIINLVSTINSIYSAKNGKDLFKATNKTVTAQTSLSSISQDYDEFKEFIENLYFLFWESCKSRLDVSPPSFSLVNTLRTEMRHDVDHGGEKKYRQKKSAIASAFEEISGIKSPEAAPPERFPFAQLALLTRLRADLMAMRRELSEAN